MRRLEKAVCNIQVEDMMQVLAASDYADDDPKFDALDSRNNFISVVENAQSPAIGGSHDATQAAVLALRRDFDESVRDIRQNITRASAQVQKIPVLNDSSNSAGAH